MVDMGSKRYRIYSQHKGSNIYWDISDLSEAREHAESSAKLGIDSLLRVFEQTSESVTGEQFVTSWSVLNGVVREHADPTIPAAHW